MVIKGLFTLTGISLRRLKIKLFKNLEVLHAEKVGVVFFIYWVVQFWHVASSIVNSATSKTMGGWVPFVLEKLYAAENIRCCSLHVL